MPTRHTISVDGEGHSFSRTAEARMRDQLFDWLATTRTRKQRRAAVTRHSRRR